MRQADRTGPRELLLHLFFSDLVPSKFSVEKGKDGRPLWAFLFLILFFVLFFGVGNQTEGLAFARQVLYH